MFQLKARFAFVYCRIECKLVLTDQTLMQSCSNRNVWSFGLNGKCPNLQPIRADLCQTLLCLHQSEILPDSGFLTRAIGLVNKRFMHSFPQKTQCVVPENIHTSPPPLTEGTFALDPPLPWNFHSRECLLDRHPTTGISVIFQLG